MRGEVQASAGRQLRLERLEDRRVLAGTPLITEFMAANSATLLDGDGRASDWIEIHNPTGAAINLGGWSLTDDAGNLQRWTFPNTTLPAGGYLVVFASSQPTDNYVDPAGKLHTNFALSAGGEYLALVDPSGIVASEYDEFPAQSPDVSYGLDAAQTGAYFSHPTPGAANDLESAVTRGIVISEIMYHPPSELATEEFVEIYNGEAASVNLAGWTLSGGVDLTLPAYTLGPGQYVAVAANVAAFDAKYPSVANVIGGWDGKLSNRTDTIQLRDDVGRQVDAVTYFDEGDWATREAGPLDLNHRGWAWSDAADGGGSSLELVSFGVSNDWGQSWRASNAAGGTPGAANSTKDADNNVAPLILDVTHFPVIPRSTNPVVISARLVDELSVGLSATLFWRVDGAPTFSTLEMADNGSGGDAVAGDQRFSAQLPAMPPATVVEFYIRSTDQAGNQRTYPTPTAPSGQQLTNLLYQVDNSFDPTAPLPGPNDPPIYRLIMTEAERAELVHIGSTQAEARSGARMNGTFVSVTSSGIEVRYRVGVANRGYGSARLLPNSYHIDFPRDAAWKGQEALNFNTQFTHLQLAGLRLFQAVGIEAEDSKIVKVRVNGADLTTPGEPSFGVYMQLEASDNVFTANHFPDDDGGNLYRAVKDATDRAFGDLRDLGTNAAAYATYFEKKTNASEADYSDLIELISVLNHASDAEYMAKLSQLTDVDEWLTYFATIAVLGSEETSLGTGSGDDYILYRGENDPRFLLIPHDLDSIFGQGDTPGTPTSSIYRAANNPVLARFFAQPEIRAAYHAKLKSLLETTFSKTTLDPMLDQLLSGFAPAQRIADMKTYMDARRTFIMNAVAAPLTATTTLATSGGFPRSTASRIAMSGVAPLAGTRSVTAASLVASYNLTTGQWTVPAASGVLLRPGINRLDVRAYDGPNGTGNILASTFIDVWYDDGSVQNVSGNITTNTFWSASGGPYVATGDVTVVGPATLTIEAGATVFFNTGSGLTVRDGGRIVAEGTAGAHIRLTRNPATGNTSWDGLALTNTSQDNRLAYVDMQAGAGAGHAMLIDHAKATIDHASWFDVTAQILDLVHPSLVVSNSNFPGISGDETIHLAGLNQGEQLVFENNIVGVNASGGDVIDLGHDTLTPPTVVFRGNTFLGGGDDGIDTDGFPVLIENNTFMNFHKNTTRSTTSNAVSTGHVDVAGQTISSMLTLRNNTFINNDHHLLLKDFSFATAVNNTFVNATFGAIHFAEPNGSSVVGPGLGAALDGNIFWGTGVVLLENTPSTQLSLNRSIVPAALVGLGVGNLAADPLLVNPAGGDFSVKRGSPALGAGPNGTDIGAVQTPHDAAASAANLRVSELHYHPQVGNKAAGEIGGDGDEFEFIELQNISHEPIDLTDVAFDNGIDFTFPWLASLGAGQTLVLAANRDLFASRYGAGVAVAGEFEGSLSNSGEAVRLVDAHGDAIAEFTFDDQSPWPGAADGSGPSLELVQAFGDATEPSAWRASAAAGGSPGVGLPALPSPADFNLTGAVDGNDFLAWQRGLGRTAPQAHQADGNSDADSDVDGADLTMWRSQFSAAEAATDDATAAAVARPDDESSATESESRATSLVDAAMAAMFAEAQQLHVRSLAVGMPRTPGSEVAAQMKSTSPSVAVYHFDQSTAPPWGGRSSLTPAATASVRTPSSPWSRRTVQPVVRSAGIETDCDSF